MLKKAFFYFIFQFSLLFYAFSADLKLGDYSSYLNGPYNKKYNDTIKGAYEFASNGDYTNAIKNFKTAISGYCGSPEVVKDLIICYIKIDKEEECFEWLERNWVSSDTPFYIISNYYYNAGEYAKAAKYLLKIKNNTIAQLIYYPLRKPYQTSSMVISKDHLFAAIGFEEEDKYSAQEKKEKKYALVLWSLENQLYEEFFGHDIYITAVAISPDSKYIASGDHKGKLILWNIKTKEKIMEMNGHSGRITQILFMENDNGKFVTSSLDGNIKIWDIEKKKDINTLSGNNYIGFLSLSDDETKINCASIYDKSTKILCRSWDYKNKKVEESKETKIPKNQTNFTFPEMYAVSPDNRYLAYEDYEGFDLLNLENGELNRYEGDIDDACFTKDSKNIITYKYYGKKEYLTIWDIEKKEKIKVLSNENRSSDYSIYCYVALSEDNRLILSSKRVSESISVCMKDKDETAKDYLLKDGFSEKDMSLVFADAALNNLEYDKALDLYNQAGVKKDEIAFIENIKDQIKTYDAVLKKSKNNLFMQYKNNLEKYKSLAVYYVNQLDFKTAKDYNTMAEIEGKKIETVSAQSKTEAKKINLEMDKSIEDIKTNYGKLNDWKWKRVAEKFIREYDENLLKKIIL